MTKVRKMKCVNCAACMGEPRREYET